MDPTSKHGITLLRLTLSLTFGFLAFTLSLLGSCDTLTLSLLKLTLLLSVFLLTLLSVFLRLLCGCPSVGA